MVWRILFTGLVFWLHLKCGHSAASQCYNCDVVGTDQTCNERSSIQMCEGGDYGGCQTAVRAIRDQSSGEVVTSIIKSCKADNVCRAEVQTYASTCTGPTTDGSICYYCCETDLCNDADTLLGLFPIMSTSVSAIPPDPNTPTDDPSLTNPPRSMSPGSSTTDRGGNNTSPSSPDNKVPTWVIILIVVVGILVIGICFLCICCFIRRRKRKRATDGLSDESKTTPAQSVEKQSVGKTLSNESSVYHDIDTSKMDSLPAAIRPSTTNGQITGDKPEQEVTTDGRQSTVKTVSNGIYGRNNSTGPVYISDAEKDKSSSNKMAGLSEESGYENHSVLAEANEYLTPTPSLKTAQ